MHIAIVGASGFIGQQVARELACRGHDLLLIGRNRATLERLSRSTSGLPILLDQIEDAVTVDGVVVTAGVFDGPGLWTANADLPRDIANWARRIGVARFVLVSAIGAAEATPTLFGRSKASGEKAVLEGRVPGWTVIRPSLVYGPSGRSMGLLANLAALPIRLRIGSGPVRPIMVDDLAAVIADLVTGTAPLPPIIDAVGPDRTDIDGYVAALAAWLGLRPFLTVRLPGSVLQLLAVFGRAVGLHWLQPESLMLLRTGADGDGSTLQRHTNVRPRGIASGLPPGGASATERLAALVGLWPIGLRIALAMLWLGSGLVSLICFESGVALLRQGGIVGIPAAALIIGGGCWDLVLGVALLIPPLRRPALATAIATMLLYTALPPCWCRRSGPILSARCSRTCRYSSP